MLWRRCHFDHSCSQNDPVHPAENNVGARSGFFPKFPPPPPVFVLLRRRFTQEHFVQKQVQADPRRKRTVENILQTFVDDVSCSCSRFLPSPLPLIRRLQHALFSHHDRGTSSSPFDPRNIYNSHSHEVDSISRGKPMTAQGDLPQRPNHPHTGTRRSGEFERGVSSQSHRSNLSDHNFAQVRLLGV